jgi:tRNA U34 5-methylaminomethyl-2-thiouridine-forming methyltransferase MnmC
VFIEAGLHAVQKSFPGEHLRILEMGFGTGLNAFMTAIEALRSDVAIRYTAIEAFPLDLATAISLNYPEQLGHEGLFNAIHLATWNTLSHIHETFNLKKREVDLLHFMPAEKYHLIYFDAFAPEAQPELWTEAVFAMLAENTEEHGLLVTYCSKGIVRRAMQAAGWKVEKLPGPKGKREMVRAIKP